MTPSAPVQSVQFYEICELKIKISNLTKLVSQIVVGQTQVAKTYGICSTFAYVIDAYPQLQQDGEVNVIGRYASNPNQN